jgi:hypothetical protein
MQHLAYRKRSTGGDAALALPPREPGALGFLDRLRELAELAAFPSGGGRRRAALTLAHARAAELRGQLAHAAALFEQAGRADEAARVIVLLGDSAMDTSERLAHYLQAGHTAPDGPEGNAVRTLARRKRASLLLALASEGLSPTVALRQALVDVARELEADGEYEVAAEAYAKGGNEEGQARCLARSGDVDRLDALLLEQQGRDRHTLARRQAHGELRTLLATGRRREALALAREWQGEDFDEQVRNLEARRLARPIVRAHLRGHAMNIVLGDEVRVGRTATIPVAASVVSREHVAIVRRGGDVFVRDLGGTNGTTLRGLMLASGGEARVGEGVEVRLGNQVPLVVQPTDELTGAVAVEVAGARYVAPLGPAKLGIGAWALERGTDGWVELSTGAESLAFAGALELAQRVTLLVGDAIATEREGQPVFEILRDD